MITIVFTSSMIILIILLIFCLVAMGIALLMINFLSTNATNSVGTEESLSRCRGLFDRRSTESFCWISADPSSSSMPRIQYHQRDEIFSFSTFKPELSPPRDLRVVMVSPIQKKNFGFSDSQNSVGLCRNKSGICRRA